jgi:hypothetical protein
VERKIPLWGVSVDWEDNIKVNLMELIRLTGDRVQCQAVVNTNILVP